MCLQKTKQQSDVEDDDDTTSAPQASVVEAVKKTVSRVRVSKECNSLKSGAYMTVVFFI